MTNRTPEASAPATACTTERQHMFIAVPLPDALKRMLGLRLSELRGKLDFRKWTNEADLHVTLQFLGVAAADRLPELKSALAAVAARQQPFGLSIVGAGTYGLPERPRVLWAGIGGELDRLRELQREIVEATAPLGFAAEDRPYSPHLTLARRYAGEEAFALPELLVRSLGAGIFTSDGAAERQEDGAERARSACDARERDAGPLREASRRSADFASLRWQVGGIVLYRTCLHRVPMYDTEARFDFG
ncbi:RNA 2',3'-cyclic phosphodiesterase [Paenibacillus glycinis]|uniref:RNA 2',3'-cyclic phosphodiesterase n=1 Tax=Paenibacillus glycinis TaxID=2697035 RepID=A0ABW9XYZ2_9BACL|nr:RNA 2',3'-cyclic phosphodiesterase [Paenibacillus glycinis]NBD27916.1 RNA 2',3'-cyclic phosphodiesterase [Paenibacillus glycinis]